MLLVASLGCLLAAIFTTDPATTDQDSLSLNGQLHGTGASLAGLIPFALLFITLALIRNANWKNNKAQLWTAMALVWLGEIVFVIAMIVYLPNNDGKLGPDTPIGWYNRLMILTYALGILWFGLMAANVKRKG